MERGRGGNALGARQKTCHRSSFCPFWMHRSSPLREQTTLSLFLVSEKMPDAGKHSKTRAEREDQMIPKGLNDAVGRIYSKGRFHALWRMSATHISAHRTRQ